MSILEILAAEALALFLALFVSKHKNDSVALHVLIVTNMLLIVRFGGWLADFGIGVSNYGCIFYATVMVSQYCIMQHGGWHQGVRCFGSVLAALGLSFAITSIMLAGPTVLGNEIAVATYADMLAQSDDFVFASFAAFITGQLFFIVAYAATEKMSIWLSYVLNMALAQAIDSVIFFSLAFELDFNLLRIMAVGYAVKVMIGLLALPAVWYMRKSVKQRAAKVS